MFFTVINEGVQIEKITIKSLAVSSILFIGDAESVSLASWFDTPAEKVIVGVTIGVTETEKTQD